MVERDGEDRWPNNNRKNGGVTRNLPSAAASFRPPVFPTPFQGFLARSAPVGEGKVFRGQLNVATDDAGDTSEFSAPRVVAAG